MGARERCIQNARTVHDQWAASLDHLPGQQRAPERRARAWLQIVVHDRQIRIGRLEERQRSARQLRGW